MKTKYEIAQWVIDNRYPKSELEKISDHELYNTIVDDIQKLIDEKDNEIVDDGPHLSQGNNDFPQNNAYVEPWESMGN